MNPCRCGFHGNHTRECRCTGAQLAQYLGKISGPLLDRIDLHVEVPAVPSQELRTKAAGASSANMRARVFAARERQSARALIRAAGHNRLKNSSPNRPRSPGQPPNGLFRTTLERRQFKLTFSRDRKRPNRLPVAHRPTVR